MDAKISNVIFTKSADKSVVLLDLETVMPVNIMSKIDDMIRTVAASISENESDFLSENIYYPVQLDDENLLRCLNQSSLLCSFNKL